MPYAAQHGFFVDLELSESLTHFDCLCGIGLARAVKGLEPGAAAFRDLAELRVQFRALELEDCQPAQKIDGQIRLGLGFIGHGGMDIEEDLLKFCGIHRLALPGTDGSHGVYAGIDDASAARNPGFVDAEVFNRAMLADQPSDMVAGNLVIFRAEKHIGPNVIDARG